MTKFYHKELSNINENAIIGDDCVIHSHVWIGGAVAIGDRVKIQAFAFIPDGVLIEDCCFIGPRVTFTNDKLPPSPDWQTIAVRRGASIGAGAVILPGVTIGENALIGAGSVVTKNVPPNQVWAGTPARYLRDK